MNILGIDYGRAHKGLAIGDTGTKIAMPLKTFDHLSHVDFIKELKKIILSYRIDLLVVGVPVTWPEDKNRLGMRDEVEKFAKLISQELNMPVELIDERYTSDAAKKLRKEYPLGNEHALSAMLILQTYFDRGVN
ncbi:hypothetical protein A3E96_00360 [Candidatus Uhrbacteria bacterium RIFCSPHIGHO2_12_FULL_46_13]|uniref:Putative pre-16S rRNA nuclease n=1 Tax=Candidatus Uhrbacteria bacterium RIFCSPLOWO2_01_FULL_47_25 TaxID=1802402 RepID=A0A1F7UWF8_9BACT|nr:MAG: hypothetical protein A2752_04555 [Candidatus Uhrbacteria bacterium RIFCSPHIGHO2_01_FULL_46_23]OGL69717.1 MAG: hypothetical protein A3D60_03475 [Candidatus Uhrbacteria bacterium RIFCSPHIGHO2_02_FULL_47_29]OGL76747.1 MAG: hypothetical protein A3E96_00360 [Candidatus Uhrbacteria bacterium RIFCSPHIGHO2_12_FULL_46_13]OGL82609.1 MAG: hypothetical protein A2936_02265 [Candidatus Uhrbacteria bacterium RIFCSPLOWO2_01_FULL_47_25]OGL86508.1 MAG: hypothetical protein A3I37_01280 [Candidatus Uhrbact